MFWLLYVLAGTCLIPSIFTEMQCNALRCGNCECLYQGQGQIEVSFSKVEPAYCDNPWARKSGLNREVVPLGRSKVMDWDIA